MIRLVAILLAAVVVALSAGGAEARAAKRAFKLSDYPLEVQKTLSVGPTTCREVEGGGKVGFAPDTVRKVDFNGDGVWTISSVSRTRPVAARRPAASAVPAAARTISW